MVAAGANKEDAKKAKKEAEEKAKAEEKEKYRLKVESMFETLLQRISFMETIAEKTEKMCDQMETCEENLQKLEKKEWVSFLQMGIIGEGDGDPGTMYEDEKKRKEAEAAAFRAEVMAKAKPMKGRSHSGYKPHHAHRNRKYVSPAKKTAGAAPEYTTVYDAETQSCKLVTWEEYLKTNKAPPCSNYVTVYNPETEEIDLLFWSQYVSLGLHDEDLAIRNKLSEASAMGTDWMAKASAAIEVGAYSGYKIDPRFEKKMKYEAPAKKAVIATLEYTTVYDAKTQSCKLVTWEEYLKTNKAPPCSNYVTVYNPVTKGVDLLFWSQYCNLGLYEQDIAARKKL